MMKKKYVQTLCFPAALVLLMQTESDARADSFMNPARGAYSLEKTLERPYLQSAPVPRVWQTDSSSEAFRKAWLDETLPETREERLLKASSWQKDAADSRIGFDSVALGGRQRDMESFANTLSGLLPVVQAGIKNAEADVDVVNDDHKAYLEKRRSSDAAAWHDALSDAHANLHVLDKFVPFYLEMRSLEKELAEKSRQEAEIEKDGFDVSLEDAEKIYAPETLFEKMALPLDEDLWFLMFNDLTDLSTGTNSLMFGEDYVAGDKKESVNRSASLLDSDRKNDHIQEDGFEDSKQRLIRSLKKMTVKVKKDEE